MNMVYPVFSFRVLMHRTENSLNLGILIALVSAALFGVYPNAARGVYEAGGDAVFVILVTTVCRMLGLTLFCLATKKALFQDRVNTRRNMLGGFLQAASVTCIFFSLNYLSGPVMITLLFTHTLMQLLFLAFRGEMRIDAVNLSCTLAALLGLSMVVNIWSSENTVSWIGVAIVMGGALATTGRMYIFEKSSGNASAAVVGAENFIFASICVCALLLYKTPDLPQSLDGYLFMAAAAGTLVLATFGMFYGVALAGAFRFSLFLKLEPVFNAVFAVLLLGELLAPVQYIGMLLVIGSMAVFKVFDRQKAMS